jgi:arsenate reductase
LTPLDAPLTFDAYHRRMEATERQRVIFVCTHNSARSQMAEGMLRAWGSDRFEAFSAGTEATRVRPEAIAVMDEIGIDISGHESKSLAPFMGDAFSWLITVCDDAREACPVIPGVANQAHWSIEDPSGVEADEGARLAAFREARDILRDRIHMFMLAAGRDDLPQPEPQRLGGTPR